MIKQLNFDLSKKPPKISQWFLSLEGEGQAVGMPSVYVRVAGCFSAACTFCDTKFSWADAPKYKDIGDWELTNHMQREFSTSHVQRMTITGGEPLHFMKWFNDIFEWIDEATPDDLRFLGIESNGNLLATEEHCMELIKSFNTIKRKHGVMPDLTISPKLDAETCYDEQMTQEEVDKMYFTVFKNISSYLQTDHVFYKFIYDYTEEIVDFDHQMKFITFLINKLSVPRNHIMLMPFTPEDPLEEGATFWKESKDATARKALELGLKYSPRMHIDRELD